MLRSRLTKVVELKNQRLSMGSCGLRAWRGIESTIPFRMSVRHTSFQPRTLQAPSGLQYSGAACFTDILSLSGASAGN